MIHPVDRYCVYHSTDSVVPVTKIGVENSACSKVIVGRS